MTPADISLRTQNINTTLATKGWKDEIAPALTKAINDIEKSLLDDDTLTGKQTKALRRERKFLLSLRDTPERLLNDLDANATRLAKSRQTGAS